MTLAADEHVRLRPSHLGQLMLSDGLFGQSLSDLLQLGARHLLDSETQKPQTLCFNRKVKLNVDKNIKKKYLKNVNAWKNIE